MSSESNKPKALLNILEALCTPIPMKERGYHAWKIPKGNPGTWEKVFEEVLEMGDAIHQNNPVMALTEASDVIGALGRWLAIHHPSITLNDLVEMSQATGRAFATKRRQ